MTIIFRAKTHEGYTIKILSELLQNTIKTACLVIHSNGINLRMMDSHRRILIDIVLHAHNFNIYEFHSNDMFLGINLTHLYRMLKAIKKKDALLLSIDEDTPNKLDLIIYPKENNRITRSSVHIHDTQNIEIPVPVGYDSPVIIPSGEYQRTLKDMNNISTTINVKMYNYSMSLACTADNIYSREVLFGELEDDSDLVYDDDYDMEQFVRILKITGLSKTIHIYGKDKLPLLIQSLVGQLGTISIYIKSKSQVRLDNETEIR